MKFDQRRRNLSKIIALTTMMVFSLFAAFSGAFAWFESVQSIQGSGDTFNVNGGVTSFASITFHRMTSKSINSTTGYADSFTFNPEKCGEIIYDWQSKSAIYDGDTSISLVDYEPLNREQPLLMVFHFNEATNTTGSSINIGGKSSATGFLGEKNSGSATPRFSLTDPNVIYKTANSLNYYWLSSAVRFYNVTFASDAELSYQYALNQEYATTYRLPLLHESPSRFVTANNENDTCSFSPNAVFYASAGETVKNIGIVVDYYADAIEYIYSTFLGDDTLETTYDGFLHFWCDWTMEVS